MSVRDLIEKWEEIANEARVEQDHAAYRAYQACARELRAALPEQPLSWKWREEADEIEKEEGEPIAPEDGQVPETLRRCASDLDTQHDEGRALLWEVIRTWKCFCAPGWDHQCTVCRIRKHLEDQQ